MAVVLHILRVDDKMIFLTPRLQLLSASIPALSHFVGAEAAGAAAAGGLVRLLLPVVDAGVDDNADPDARAATDLRA